MPASSEKTIFVLLNVDGRVKAGDLAVNGRQKVGDRIAGRCCQVVDVFLFFEI
jgi:hypothetical protein